MATRSSHNKNNSAVKRIMQEARELASDPSTDYTAAPLEDDIFEWHCTLRGPVGTEFEGGLYHFRILLPAEYPFRPPAIMMLTPSGRFELNTKICISFTNYHEDQWQPAWGVRTAIIGLQGFFPLKGEAAVGVGALEMPSAQRKRLAALSREWVCPHCSQPNAEMLPDPPSSSSDAGQLEPIPSSRAKTVSDPPSVSTGAPSPSPAAAGLEPEHDLHFVNATTPSRPVESSSVIAVRTAPAAIVSPGPATSSSAVLAHGSTIAQTSMHRSSSRPPLLLDGAIVVLMSLVLALLAKKFS